MVRIPRASNAIDLAEEPARQRGYDANSTSHSMFEVLARTILSAFGASICGGLK